MAIAAPEDDSHHDGRDADCERAIASDFEDVVAKAAKPGRTSEDVSSELVETAGRLRGLMTAFGERAALLDLESDLMLLVERATDAGWHVEEVVNALQRLAKRHAEKAGKGQ